MKHMLRLTDYSIDELTKIFNIADEITLGNYKDILGFIKYGTFPSNMKYSDGTYASADWMMKKL